MVDAPDDPLVSEAVPLLGGSYSARGLIGSAQRCVNLYPEFNPKTAESAPVTHQLTAGLVQAALPLAGEVRCLYRTTQGVLYAVVANKVYSVAVSGGVGPPTLTLLGTMASSAGYVSICDNGTVAVIVDGTAAGYTVVLNTGAFATIADAAFYGANRVVYLDTFFVFNKPSTAQFYLSPSFWNGTDPFDATYLATKTGVADLIVSLAVDNRNLYLIGSLSTEVWVNVGGATFPFARQDGVFFEHGAVGPAAVIESDVSTYFLHRDRQGANMLMAIEGYQAKRISNHAVELAIQSYATTSDVRLFVYQMDGHTFVVLTFPSADHTWVYDASTDQWHEWVSYDGAGAEHRHRSNCYAHCYGAAWVGDYASGQIYWLQLGAYTDAGQAITRRRTFPHLVKDGRRRSFASFIADMDVSQVGGSPSVYLRWSDDRGASWGTPLALPFGSGSNTSLLARNLGMARDRVFELYWSFAYPTALQGAWLTEELAET